MSLDPWSDDDPAIARMREALERPRTPEPAEVAPASAPEPIAPPDESSARHRRISELIARLNAGDHGVCQELEDMISG